MSKVKLKTLIKIFFTIPVIYIWFFSITFGSNCNESINVCGWLENVFIVKNQTIFTPTPENCLNGITRQSVIQIAKDLKMQIYEKNIDYDDLLNADEAFFTGTAVEITPITIVDNKPVNNGKRGNITKELQDKFQQIISGEDSSYESWLTYTN